MVFSESLRTQNGINFTRDGRTLYLSGSIDRKFDNDRNYSSLFITEFENDDWSAPLRLILEPDIDAYHPVLSFDNQHLFFNSRSGINSGNVPVKNNIWVVERIRDGWGSASMVEGVNSDAYDSYPTVAKNGNLYFNSDRDGGQGSMDIYVARFIDGKFRTPENLSSLNSEDSENDQVVDPDERFIIFNRYVDATRSLDLFISFNKDEDWTAPRPLDNINSSEIWELTPTLSPDGQYFFFESEGRIMQIDLARLIYPEELKGVGNRERTAD